MLTRTTGGAKPPIHISRDDYDRIANLALGIEHSAPAVAGLVFDEIDRAEMHDADTLPPDVVALGSDVEFVDLATDRTRAVRLVVPSEADIEQGRISVMTSIGAGLIGMAAGHEIDWPYPDGRPRVLKILSVRQN